MEVLRRHESARGGISSDLPPGRGEHFEAQVTDLVIRLIILGLFAYLSLSLIRPFLPILVRAVILAVALAPLPEWLARRLNGSRRLAAILVMLVVLIVAIGPVAALAAACWKLRAAFPRI